MFFRERPIYAVSGYNLVRPDGMVAGKACLRRFSGEERNGSESPEQAGKGREPGCRGVEWNAAETPQSGWNSQKPVSGISAQRSESRKDTVWHGDKQKMLRGRFNRCLGNVCCP